MISGIGTQFEIGNVVTLTTSAVAMDDEGNAHKYDDGERGELAAWGEGEDRTIVALFDGRPPLCCTPGDDCVIGDPSRERTSTPAERADTSARAARAALL